MLGLAFAGAVAGCSDTAVPSPTSTTDRAGAGVALPAGHRWVQVPTQAVTIAVPQAWVDFASTDTPEALAAAAEAMGTTVEDLQANLPAATLLQVRAPSPDPSNINAVVIDLETLPSDAELTSQFEEAGAREVTPRAVHTAAGDAVLITYDRPLSGGTVHGAGLFVDLGSSLLNLSVTSPDRATVTTRAEALVRSIHLS